MPANPSSAPHTSPRRSPPPKRQPGSCGVGRLLLPGRKSFPATAPSSRHRGRSPLRREAGALPGSCWCSAQPGPALPVWETERRGGKRDERTRRGRTRPAFRALGSSGVVRQEYGGVSRRRSRSPCAPPSSREERNPRPAALLPTAAERRAGEARRSTGRILTPNGREELCVLRFVLPDSAFPTAAFAFASFAFSRGHTFYSAPIRGEMTWVGRTGGKCAS
ncbi:uncharacterized protein [Pithys albifrons albifrons]|uniref:uncharacterized protein n=1 Tax=Pithys albifrons albifrons TaxID=3385563 RepID=UPI003A5CD20A